MHEEVPAAAYELSLSLASVRTLWFDALILELKDFYTFVAAKYEIQLPTLRGTLDPESEIACACSAVQCASAAAHMMDSGHLPESELHNFTSQLSAHLCGNRLPVFMAYSNKYADPRTYLDPLNFGHPFAADVTRYITGRSGRSQETELVAGAVPALRELTRRAALGVFDRYPSIGSQIPMPPRRLRPPPVAKGQSGCLSLVAVLSIMALASATAFACLLHGCW